MGLESSWKDYYESLNCYKVKNPYLTFESILDKIVF